MAKIKKRMILDIGGKESDVTSGYLILERNMLLTGHSDGSILSWNLITHQSSQVLRVPGHRISAISLSPSGSVVAGSATGALVVFPINNPSKAEVITQATHHTTDRIWRVAWASDTTFYVGMNYGELRRVTRSKNHWELKSLQGHSNAVFGLDTSSKQYVAAGDYRGNVSFRELNSDVSPFQFANVGSGIQDAAWLNDGRLAVITKTMGIHYFELDSSGEKTVFRRTCRIDIGDGTGACVALAPDGKRVFGGTSCEIILFNIEKLTGRCIPSNPCVKLWLVGENLYVLTESEFVEYKVGKIDYPAGVVSSKQVKVSLLGHTGAGKTTLCEKLITGMTSKAKSTFGKRIWRWEPDDSKGKIIFFDHGGQEAVIGTFIPFLEDSDMILIVFKRTEYVSFENAMKVLKEIRGSIPNDTPIVIIETHRDDLDATMAESTFKPMVEKGMIAGYFSVSSTEGDGIQEFAASLLNMIRWNEARRVVETETSSQVRELVETLRESGVSTLSVGDFRTRYHDVFSKYVPEQHLRFLLRGLSSEGLLAYYPDVLDTIIINDDEFNQLWSKMPILAKSKGGIVSLSEIRKSFPKLRRYVSLIDRIFVTHEICLEYKKLRVFPESLPKTGLVLQEQFRKILSKSKSEEKWIFNPKEKVQRAFFKGLFDMNLSCHSATQAEGLFAWKKNAVLYYRLEQTGTPFENAQLIVNWRVGGEKEKAVKRLSLRFQKLMELMLGDPIETPLLKIIRDREKYNAEFKASLRWDYEKGELNKDLEYEVARAIAGMMNAKDGMVLIGVSDEGDILGLDKDYNLLGKKRNRDGFELRLLDVIDSYIGRECAEWFSIEFSELFSREICIVEVRAAPREMFLQKNPRKKQVHFVARVGNSTREFNMKEYKEYKKDHWGV